MAGFTCETTESAQTPPVAAGKETQFLTTGNWSASCAGPAAVRRAHQRNSVAFSSIFRRIQRAIPLHGAGTNVLSFC